LQRAKAGAGNHGGPRQGGCSLGALDERHGIDGAVRDGATSSTTSQRPTRQCGQRSMSIAATRRMKSRTFSRARGSAGGIASSWRASASRSALAAGASSP